MKYLFLIGCFFFAGCAVLTLELRPEIKKTTSFTHYSHYLVWGLASQDKLNMDQACMDQTLVRIKNYFTIEDILFAITTAGLYTPKSTKIWCEQPPVDSEEIIL